MKGAANPMGRSKAGSGSIPQTRGMQRETDLYPPVKRYLESLGYVVKGEVKGCDVVAARGDELVVVELKRHFSTAVLIQAVDRQAITDAVYIAVPRQKGGGMRGRWKGVRRLLRRLELGLLLVSDEPGTVPVTVALHPAPCPRRRRNRDRQALLREFRERTGDQNVGGSRAVPIITAYRERAVRIAYFLDAAGEPLTPRQLRALGTGADTTEILYRNVYGWFERVRRGVYTLTDVGRDALPEYRHLMEEEP